MRRLWIVVLVLVSGVARGADTVKPEDLKKLYDDTLVQLKAAQDRKSQLAAENEKLTAHITDLEKQLAAQNSQIEDLRRQVTLFADRTYFLRSHYAAWLQFIEANAPIRLQWDLFLEQIGVIGPGAEPAFFDPNWPLSAKG